MTIALVERDCDIVETLTLRVPVISLDHATMLWWPNAQHARPAQKRMRALARAGWLERYIIVAPRKTRLHGPLLSWKPGQPDPNAEQISLAAQARWSQATRPTEAYTASPLAACLMGSPSRGLPAQDRRDHAMRLAAVYVHYRITSPRLADRWLGKQALSKPEGLTRDPDAILCDSDGRLLRVIECAGQYGAAQVERLHEEYAASEVPYELW